MIRRDTTSAPPAGQPQGPANGWILRVGSKVDPNNPNDHAWELESGYDLKSSPYKPATALVYVVGQGLNPDGGNFYSGGAQDIGAYSTFIQLR